MIVGMPLIDEDLIPERYSLSPVFGSPKLFYKMKKVVCVKGFCDEVESPLFMAFTATSTVPKAVIMITGA